MRLCPQIGVPQLQGDTWLGASATWSWSWFPPPVLLSGGEPPHPVVAVHCWVNPAGHGIGQLIHRDLVCSVTRWETQVVLQLHGNH